MMSRGGQCRYGSGSWRTLCAIPRMGGVLVGLGAGGKIVLEIVGVGELLERKVVYSLQERLSRSVVVIVDLVEDLRCDSIIQLGMRAVQ